MNNVNLVGRLTKDPELRRTQNDMAVCNFTLAVENPFNKEDGTDFINCVAWGKPAEIISEYVKKGHRFGLVGRLQTRTWEKDGITRYATDVIVRDFDFLEPKAKSDDRKEEQKSKESTEVVEDDLPF